VSAAVEVGRSYLKEEAMPVPKRRTSKTRKRKRRAHLALVPATTVVCKKCGHPTMPHAVCSNCGSYRGREILEVEEA
jgi:large subunit ribosomal protein L32